MSKTIAEFTMSLDGFIAGPNDDVRALFGWYFSGDTELHIAGAPPFKMARASAELLRESWAKHGDKRDGAEGLRRFECLGW